MPAVATQKPTLLIPIGAGGNSKQHTRKSWPRIRKTCSNTIFARLGLDGIPITQATHGCTASVLGGARVLRDIQRKKQGG